MDHINAEFIERYQLILEKDPTSKLFAPLAEAYRKMKLYDQALKLCKSGLEHNPQFAPGYIALGKIYMSQNKITDAHKSLMKACQLSSENLLAHELLAECELQLKKPKNALRAYKMVLFLNPNHTRAQRAVKKLESLTADEYDDEIFSMEKLSQAATKMTSQSTQAVEPELEVEAVDLTAVNNDSLIDRHISLVDAFIARNDMERAQKALLSAEEQLGPHPEITKRKPYILRNQTLERYEATPTPEPIKPLELNVNTDEDSLGLNLEQLEELLHQFDPPQ